ncbi:MAG: LCP family protein [Lacisediminihabitans sp.]
MSELRPRTNRGNRPAPVARHGQLGTTNPVLTVLKFVAGALAVALVSGLGVTAISAYQLTQDLGPGVHLVGETAGPPPQIGDYPGGFNVLIAGSDDGSGLAKYGIRGESLNDVTILLHVSADHGNAVAVSIPRDLIVPIPACPRVDGKGNYHAMAAQMINVTLEYGGLPCTVLTVEALTGLTIPYAGVIHFQGVVEMSNAIGGVPVCVNAPINDPYSGLSLPAGTSYVKGDQALAFLRSRHGVGDGSDLGRINSQQVFLSSMVRTIRSSDVLTNPVKLFSLARAAARNMQLSSSLNNPATLVAMADTLRKIPPQSISFVQYPSAVGLPGIPPARVGPLKAEATALFNQIKADKPFALNPNVKKIGSEVVPQTSAASAAATPVPASSSSATSSPTPAATLPVLQGIQGQTADQQTCSLANRR